MPTQTADTSESRSDTKCFVSNLQAFRASHPRPSTPSCLASERVPPTCLPTDREKPSMAIQILVRQALVNRGYYISNSFQDSLYSPRCRLQDQTHLLKNTLRVHSPSSGAKRASKSAKDLTPSSSLQSEPTAACETPQTTEILTVSSMLKTGKDVKGRWSREPKDPVKNDHACAKIRDVVTTKEIVKGHAKGWK